jgi:hypothetical protein
MDRDLGTPKKSQESLSTCAISAHGPAGLLMKQTRRGSARLATQKAASSKAHDRDAMFNKEFYR